MEDGKEGGALKTGAARRGVDCQLNECLGPLWSACVQKGGADGSGRRAQGRERTDRQRKGWGTNEQMVKDRAGCFDFLASTDY